GGWIAVQIGTLITSARADWPGFEALERHVGEVLVVPAGAGTWTVLIGQPLAAAAVYLAATMLHPEPDLGRGDGPVGPGLIGLPGGPAPVSSAGAAPRTRRCPGVRRRRSGAVRPGGRRPGPGRRCRRCA